jgi:hypothetical protein
MDIKVGCSYRSRDGRIFKIIRELTIGDPGHELGYRFVGQATKEVGSDIAYKAITSYTVLFRHNGYHTGDPRNLATSPSDLVSPVDGRVIETKTVARYVTTGGAHIHIEKTLDHSEECYTLYNKTFKFTADKLIEFLANDLDRKGRLLAQYWKADS